MGLIGSNSSVKAFILVISIIWFIYLIIHSNTSNTDESLHQ